MTTDLLKTTWRSRFQSAAAVLTILLAMAAFGQFPAAFAEDAKAEAAHCEWGQHLQGPEGSWLYTVTIPGFTTFQGIETYSAGGGYSEADQLSFNPSSVASAGHGAWKSTGERTFVLTYIYLTFESFSSGVPFGTLKVRQNTRIDQTGNSYSGSGDYAYYGTDGKALQGDGYSGTFTITAKRILVQAPK